MRANVHYPTSQLLVLIVVAWNTAVAIAHLEGPEIPHMLLPNVIWGLCGRRKLGISDNVRLFLALAQQLLATFPLLVPNIGIVDCTAQFPLLEGSSGKI
jgi:hypothetical protein